MPSRKIISATARAAFPGVLLVQFAVMAQQQPALRSAAELYRSGDCRAAVAEWDNKAAGSAETGMLATCLLTIGEPAKARDAIQRLSDRQRLDDELVVLRWRAWQQEGNLRTAVPELENAAKTTDSEAVHLALADAYAASGREADAAAIYKAAIERYPDDIPAKTGLAEVALTASRLTEAASMFGAVLELSPSNLRALKGAGETEMKAGHTAQAIEFYTKALKLEPDDWPLTQTIAEGFGKLGQWRDFVRVMKFDALLRADDEKLTLRMSGALVKIGDSSLTESYYRDVLQKAVANVTARWLLARYYYDAKRWKDARPEYLALVTVRKNDPEVSYRLGQMAELEGDTQEALKRYIATCALPAATMAMRSNLGSLYWQTGDFANARDVMAGVLTAEPANREAEWILVRAAEKLQKWDEVSRYGKELLTAENDNPELLGMLARAALKQDKELEAVEYYERDLSAKPDDRDARFQLVSIYTNSDTLNKLDRALELVNVYVQKNPDDAEGYLFLGNLYRRSSDLNAARENFERGFLKMPAPVPARLSWAYNSYGIVLFRMGKFDDALTYQTRAMELNPADEQSQYNLALIYLKLKKKDELSAARSKLQELNSTLLPQLDKLIESSQIFGKGRP